MHFFGDAAAFLLFDELCKETENSNIFFRKRMKSYPKEELGKDSINYKVFETEMEYAEGLEFPK